MSASRTKKERQAAVAAGLTTKQQKALAEEKKTKRNTIIYTIIAIVVAIAIIVLLFWDSGFVQKRSKALTVGNKSYTAAELDYFYYSEYSTYSYYASMYGLDTSKALDEQELYDGYTWDDMLKDSAIADVTQISVLSQEAEAAGYELSDEAEQNINDSIANITVSASSSGVSVTNYLKSVYGEYMTIDAYERVITQIQLASEYADVKQDSFEVTDDEIASYYDENSAAYDTIDYSAYLVKFDTTEEDEDGNTVDLDEATIEENRATAEAEAQEILDAMNNGGDVDSLVEEYGADDYSNRSTTSTYAYVDWMNDKSNQAGASTLLDYTVGDTLEGYYAVRINDRELDEYCGVDIRAIVLNGTENDDGTYDMSTAETTATSVIAEFEAGDQTAEAFGELADTYSDDTSYEGGLQENVSKDTYSDTINSWLWDASRQSGDYKRFTDSDSGTIYLIYYVGTEDTPYWKTQVIDAIKSDDYSTWLDETTDSYTVVNGMGLHFVG